MPQQSGRKPRFDLVQSGRPDGNADAYPDFPIGAPGFEPGTSASRTQRSTGLSHAPHLPCSRHRGRRCQMSSHGRGGMDLASLGRLAQRSSLVRFAPTHFCRSARTHFGSCFAVPVGSNQQPSCSYGRGGIRTHAGFHPHDFQSCALSHSATRPETLCRGRHYGGSGIRTHAGLTTQRLSRAPP